MYFSFDGEHKEGVHVHFSDRYGILLDALRTRPWNLAAFFIWRPFHGRLFEWHAQEIKANMGGFRDAL